jgi:flagellin-like hook-associated protein FlgL
LQELAVLAGNDSNTDADLHAIDKEAEALGDEFHRLMSTSKYKGKDIFVTTAASEYVSMGGRDAEMTFGIGTVSYSELHNGTSAAGDDLAHKPSDVFDAAQELNVLVKNTTYEIATVANLKGDNTDKDLILAGSDLTTRAEVAIGTTFTVGSSDITLTATETLGVIYSTNVLTQDIEAVQAKINTARVQAGSQYAALESAVGYVTDLTAQYELGYNTVNDVNFSMETAHLAKNQILQQAATAMLAQANQGQASLLQLIQS